MYLGNSEELRQRIKDYNAGPQGNFLFSRRDLESIGKTFRGTTPQSRDYEYVRDFAINSTNLKEEIRKIIQEQSKPGDNLWNSTPQFIYFYLGLRTTDTDTWILVKKKSLYLAAKNGTGYTRPTLRFIQQTPITIVENFWPRPNLQEILGIDKETWEKIKKAEKELWETEQKKRREENEKLYNLWNQTNQEVHDLYRNEVQWEDLEFSSDYLNLFFTDKCSCERPGEDWHHHMLNCVGRKFSEVEEFTKQLKEEIQKAVDKFIQNKETLIKKVEDQLTAKGLSEAEVFDSKFYETFTSYGGDWRAHIRSLKFKFILKDKEQDLLSYIDSKSRLKNHTPPPADETGNQNQNWEDWWEKKKQEWAQADQAARQKEEEERKKEEEKEKQRKQKENERRKNKQKARQAEFDRKQEQEKQNDKGDREFKPKTNEIPSFLPPENLEEIPQDNQPPPPPSEDSPFTPLKPDKSPRKKKNLNLEEKIQQLRTEIENLKKIPSLTPQQKKELRDKEEQLRWLEDSKKKKDNSPQEKTQTKISSFNFGSLVAGAVVLILVVLVLLAISQKKRGRD